MPAVKDKADRQPNAQSDHRTQGSQERQVVRANPEADRITHQSSQGKPSHGGDDHSANVYPHLFYLFFAM
jgi:hypothetical protein